MSQGGQEFSPFEAPPAERRRLTGSPITNMLAVFRPMASPTTRPVLIPNASRAQSIRWLNCAKRKPFPRAAASARSASFLTCSQPRAQRGPYLARHVLVHGAAVLSTWEPRSLKHLLIRFERVQGRSFRKLGEMPEMSANSHVTILRSPAAVVSRAGSLIAAEDRRGSEFCPAGRPWPRHRRYRPKKRAAASASQRMNRPVS